MVLCLVLTVVAGGAAGCARPTELAAYPPPGSAAASAYPLGRTVTPTLTPPITVTPTPRASPAAGLAETVVVGVSLKEAERQVLAWLDPEREPRIDWARYLRRDAFVAAFAPRTWLADMSLVPREDRPLDDLNDAPLIVVAASTLGIDAFAGPPFTSWIAPPELTSPNRVPVFAVFDAVTGERRIAMAPWASEWEDWTDIALAAPTAAVRFAPEAKVSATPRPTALGSSATPYLLAPSTWTPSPTPTDVPAAARLTRSNMPTDLRPAFEAYPLIPGTSWTWRYTLTTGNVRWEAMVLTETVEAAWLEGATVVVRSSVAAQSITGENGGDRTAADSLPESLLRRIGLNGISNSDSPGQTGSRDGAATSPEPPDVPAILLSARFVADDGGIDNRVSDGPTTLVTRAGTFSGCWRSESTVSAGAGATRWFCPGIGIVAYGNGVGGSFSAWSVAELIRWRRGYLPER
jgi:hypothetical protein